MKAEPRLGLILSWPRITSAFLIDVAVLLVARRARRTRRHRTTRGVTALTGAPKSRSTILTGSLARSARTRVKFRG